MWAAALYYKLYNIHGQLPLPNAFYMEQICFFNFGAYMLDVCLHGNGMWERPYMFSCEKSLKNLKISAVAQFIFTRWTSKNN